MFVFLRKTTTEKSQVCTGNFLVILFAISRVQNENRDTSPAEEGLTNPFGTSEVSNG